jgi:hypothetical protein
MDGPDVIHNGAPCGTILADPPCRVDTWSEKGLDRCPDGPRGHYATMTLDEIAALPVGRLAAPDCRLFLWTIDSHLPQALRLGEAWGLGYHKKQILPCLQYTSRRR